MWIWRRRSLDTNKQTWLNWQNVVGGKIYTLPKTSWVSHVSTTPEKTSSILVATCSLSHSSSVIPLISHPGTLRHCNQIESRKFSRNYLQQKSRRRKWTPSAAFHEKICNLFYFHREATTFCLLTVLEIRTFINLDTSHLIFIRQN